MQDNSSAKLRHDEIFQCPAPIQAIAINDYEALNSFELSFKKGDYFLISNIHGLGFCYARTGNRQGIVQCKYLQLLQAPALPKSLVIHPQEQAPHNSNKVVINNQINFFFNAAIPSGRDEEPHKSDIGNIKSMTKTIKKIIPISQGNTCHECGTSSTLRWRKKSNDLSALCNKCGLRDRRKHIKAKRKAEATRTSFFTPAVITTTSSPIAHEYCQEKPRHFETESLKFPNYNNKASISFILH